uniref:Uncharacterized protein n=1 Tax=Arundo donax TaxID=35708 RepID=A0A0A9ET45_ARUDO
MNRAQAEAQEIGRPSSLRTPFQAKSHQSIATRPPSSARSTASVQALLPLPVPSPRRPPTCRSILLGKQARSSGSG